jgi:hypothetical protein
MRYLLFIAMLLPLNCFSQIIEMKENQNQIDKLFIQSDEIRDKINTKCVLNSELILYAEIKNDSLISIYVRNKSDKNTLIQMQERQLFLIQEAKDKDGNWKPIEYWKYASCGNSYFSCELAPNETMKSETKSYFGKFKTEIRFKLRNRNKIYFSNVLKGKIELSQFDVTNSVKIKANIFNILIENEKLNFLEPLTDEQYIRDSSEIKYIKINKK